MLCSIWFGFPFGASELRNAGIICTHTYTSEPTYHVGTVVDMTLIILQDRQWAKRADQIPELFSTAADQSQTLIPKGERRLVEQIETRTNNRKSRHHVVGSVQYVDIWEEIGRVFGGMDTQTPFLLAIVVTCLSSHYYTRHLRLFYG